jgi:hypothetical protein
MVKRGLLAFTFVAALSAASFGIGSQAMAWSDCNAPGYVAAYPAPYYAAPYGSAWAPRLAYYPAVAPVRAYPVYYGRGYDHHHDHHHNGLTVSFGF